MAVYQIKATVEIDLELKLEDTEKPTAETVKFCFDQDIGDNKPIMGAINDSRVINFCCKKVSDRN